MSDTHVLNWLKKELRIKDESKYLNDWIAARGDIMDVVVEALDMHSDNNILNNEERALIDTYRCLSKTGKIHLNAKLSACYDEECEQRKQG